MITTLSLTSKKTSATTYTFRATDGFGWALCTINDVTGELNITSDWGNWSHRWDPSPSSLGHATLTEFIGTRSDLDYIAGKLARGGQRRRWSADGTVEALRRCLCERRLNDGRCQLELRLEPEDFDETGEVLVHLRGRYTRDGLPITSGLMPADHRSGRSWDQFGFPYKPLPYLDRNTARRIWREIGGLVNDDGDVGAALFYIQLQSIDGFADYVTTEPWEYGVTEQTPEDRALRNLILPALCKACREP